MAGSSRPDLKGKPRPLGAGRKKGTPNKKTQDLMEKCEARGVDVFDLMLEFVTIPCEPALRLQALKELCQYLYPKRKALDITANLDGAIEVIVRDYTREKK